MNTPKNKKILSIQVIDPDSDHANDHFDDSRTTTVHRRTRALVVEVEERIEVRSKAEKPNA